MLMTIVTSQTLDSCFPVPPIKLMHRLLTDYVIIKSDGVNSINRVLCGCVVGGLDVTF